MNNAHLDQTNNTLTQTDLIQLIDVSKTYLMGKVEIQALREINLTIAHGEYMAVLGPSGSGKSTLMNILGCLDIPTHGQYYLDGQDVSGLSRNQLAGIRNQKIGFIFQSFNLLEYASALDNVSLPLVYQGVNAKERRERAEAMLIRVGLENRLKHHPSELSGGQRQRVAIARALVTRPSMILADEPTGNLDTQSGKDIMALFAQLSAEGTTIIIVTHDLTIAHSMKRVITICDGIIQR